MIQHHYRVHKFILSACSTVFRKILTSNPLNTSIYLRGIHHEELESILQFIYLGEATSYHERMNELLNVSKNLDIKEIGKNVFDEEEETGYVNKKQNFNEDNSIQLDENQINDVPIIASQVLTNDSSSLLNNQKMSYECHQCDYQATNKGNLNVHVQI